MSACERCGNLGFTAITEGAGFDLKLVMAQCPCSPGPQADIRSRMQEFAAVFQEELEHRNVREMQRVAVGLLDGSGAGVPRGILP